MVVAAEMLHSLWVRVLGKCTQHRDGKTLLEDSWFGRPVWSRSMGMSEEEEVWRLIKTAPLKVGTGVTEMSGVERKASMGILGGNEGQAKGLVAGL